MDARLKINSETGKVEAILAWHPVGDTWIHIAQFFEEDRIKYCVDGVEVVDLPSIASITKIVMPKEDQNNSCEDFSNGS